MRNDTDYLLSSPRNAKRLLESINDLRRLYNPILKEPIPEDMKRLLAKLD